MVPYQPRQIVIISVPIAALFVYLWYKRRKNSLCSDPGGTLAQVKLVDKTENSSQAITAKLFKEQDLSKTPVVEQPITVGSVETPVENTPSIILLDEIEEHFKDKEATCKVSCNESISHSEDKFGCEEEKVLSETLKPLPKGTLDGVEAKEVDACSVNKGLNSEPNDIVVVEHKVVKKEEVELKSLNIEEVESNSVTIEEVKPDSVNIEELEPKRVKDLEVEFKTVKDEEVETKRVKNEEVEPKRGKSKGKSKRVGPKSVKYEIEPKRVEDKEVTRITIIPKKDCALSYSEALKRAGSVSVDSNSKNQPQKKVGNFKMAHEQKIEDTTNNNNMGLEQKLASLGLDTKAPTQRTERDSANHSPAEVMLNSPAISTFSDAHSEGSSDSGKGCSDVATPPSRTPAGGSSLAGDMLPSVYEFVLPQVIVGRLIGRHGAFLHDIRAKTHTHIFIKKHPDTNSLKVCAIEGSQQDIDAALKMIRQKFPLRRFPDLTLERVTFVKNPCFPIIAENLHLHLVEGLNNDVILSSLITAGQFFLQMPMHISYQSLYKLACIMNTVYNTQESPPLQEPQPNVVCVAPAHGGWYRAQIMSVDEEHNTSEIKFLDYGGYMAVDNNTLRQIRGDFLLLPFQAVECVLANVVPAGGEEEWSEEATQFVQLMTTNQTLQAQVYDYTDTGLPLVYLYCTQFYQSMTDPSGYETRVVLLNEELVSRGFAELLSSQEENGQERANEAP